MVWPVRVMLPKLPLEKLEPRKNSKHVGENERFNAHFVHVLPSLEEGVLVSVAKETSKSQTTNKQLQDVWKRLYGYLIPSCGEGFTQCCVAFDCGNGQQNVERYPICCVSPRGLLFLRPRDQKAILKCFMKELNKTCPVMCSEEFGRSFHIGFAVPKTYTLHDNVEESAYYFAVINKYRNVLTAWNGKSMSTIGANRKEVVDVGGSSKQREFCQAPVQMLPDKLPHTQLAGPSVNTAQRTKHDSHMDSDQYITHSKVIDHTKTKKTRVPAGPSSNTEPSKAAKLSAIQDATNAGKCPNGKDTSHHTQVTKSLPVNNACTTQATKSDSSAGSNQKNLNKLTTDTEVRMRTHQFQSVQPQVADPPTAATAKAKKLPPYHAMMFTMKNVVKKGNTQQMPIPLAARIPPNFPRLVTRPVLRHITPLQFAPPRSVTDQMSHIHISGQAVNPSTSMVDKTETATSSTSSTINPMATVNKKPKKRPQIQPHVNIEEIATTTGDFSEVNVVTLVDWLRKHDVPCRMKERKNELVEKVFQWFNNQNADAASNANKDGFSHFDDVMKNSSVT